MQNKSVAIVTGASQGIGRAAAIRLACDFEAIVLTARQQDELKNTAAEVECAGAKVLMYALDLRELSRSRLSSRARWIDLAGLTLC